MKLLREMLQILLKNWVLKLTAIFLALILWIVVRGDPSAERVVTVPLEIRIPRNMEIVNERPNSVDVMIRGPSSNMGFVSSIPTCNIDLRSADEGEHIVPLTSENLRMPNAAGVEIVGIRPTRIVIDLELTVSRELPVSVMTRGEPAAGYDIYKTSADPARILVSGPRSHVEALSDIPTEIVPLSGEMKSIRTFINLSVKDPVIHTSPMGPVEVEIEIGAHRKPVTIQKVPVRPDGEGFTVSPSSVSVLLLVPANLNGKLTPADINAIVAVEGLDSSKPAKVKPDVKLNTRLDYGIAIKEIQPAEVTVRKTGKS
jgi:YbbR domain-containing protein